MWRLILIFVFVLDGNQVIPTTSERGHSRLKVIVTGTLQTWNYGMLHVRLHFLNKFNICLCGGTLPNYFKFCMFFSSQFEASYEYKTGAVVD